MVHFLKNRDCRIAELVSIYEERMNQQNLIDDKKHFEKRQILVGKVYKHYSGKLYKVIAIAHDSEDPELLRVVYQGLYDDPVFGENPIWSRVYDMFVENVVIDGVIKQRFEEVE